MAMMQAFSGHGLQVGHWGDPLHSVHMQVIGSTQTILKVCWTY